MKTHNYLIGYGSLMEEESRTRTTPTAKVAFPISVSGLMRGWFARTDVVGLTTTFLGCVRKDDHDSNYRMNAVIYRTTEEELEATDKRELNYEREEVPRDHITDYVSVLPDNARVWIYLNKFTAENPMEKAFPNMDFPIVQSYVDICVNGCLEMEALYPEAKKKQFAKDFLTTTYHWSTFWVNDRVYPRRPFIFRPNAYDIDALIKEHLPEYFDKIYFE